MAGKISFPNPPGFSPESSLDSGSTLTDRQGNPLPFEQQLDNGDYMRAANDELEAIKNSNPKKPLNNAEAARILNLRPTRPSPSFASRSPQSNARDRAADTARTAEQGAAGVKKAADAATKASTGNVIGAGADALKAAKNFKNATKGKDQQQKGGILSSSLLKKPAPTIATVAILAVFFLIFALPTLMPIHLVENIKAGFNSLFASNSTAQKKSVQAMLDVASSQEYTGISEEGCAELAMTNLTYSECAGAKEDPDIQAYYRQKALEDSTLASTTLTATSSAARVFKYVDPDGVPNTIDSENFDAWWEDAGFRDAITRGSLSWTGSFSGWFDDMIAQLTNDYGVNRNNFQGYYEEIENQVDSAETYRSIIGAVNKKATLVHNDRERLHTRDDSNCTSLTHTNDINRVIEIRDYIDSGFIQHKSIERQNTCYLSRSAENFTDWEKFIDTNYDANYITEVYDDFENLIGYNVYDDFIWNTSTSTIVKEELADAKDKITSYLPEFARSFALTSGIEKNADDTCSKLFGISYFSSIVAATRLEQAADFATKALESIDKMRAGLGAESPIHQLSKQLSETGDYDYLDPDGNEQTNYSNKPALNSQALAWTTTNSSVDLNDPNIIKLSLEGVFKGAILSTTTFSQCLAIEISGNLLFSALSLLLGGSSGASSSGFFGEAHDAPALTGKKPDGSVTDEQLDEAITRAAYGFIFNPCTEPAGEDVGNCLALGSHYYLSKNHQVGGGTIGDESKVREFIRQHRVVVAQQAEQERATRSPFDPTSQHTFLGNIVNSITPYIATLASSNLFTSIGNIVGSSIASLSPAASAITEETLMTNIGNCRLLGSGSYKGVEGLGVVGDAFCVPYMITDLSPTSQANQKTPMQVEELISADFSGKDENGNPIIRSDSDFARYIKYCSQRMSIFGIIDANIVDDYTKGIVNGNFFLRLATLLVPSAIDIVQNNNKADILGWATGQYCIATNDANVNPKWGQNQLYQYYMLYQRINQNRGGVKQNNALPIVKGYREAQPIKTDDDLTAAMSGLPTENYLAIKSNIIYAALDKSTFGPTLASNLATPRLQFRHSITPLTDFLIEKTLLITPPTPNKPKQQGITA